jgi:putative endonuclease
LRSIPAKAGTHAWCQGAMFYVYMLTSKAYGTIYVGMISDLLKRNVGTQKRVVPGFTRRYGVDRLVWFEAPQSHEAALRREKQIKEWRRDWKINLIERENRYWADLSDGLTL